MENLNKEKNTNQLDPKEMQKISFREQMWRNHKAWCKHYKNSHRC